MSVFKFSKHSDICTVENDHNETYRTCLNIYTKITLTLGTSLTISHPKCHNPTASSYVQPLHWPCLSDFFQLCPAGFSHSRCGYRCRELGITLLQASSRLLCLLLIANFCVAPVMLRLADTSGPIRLRYAVGCLAQRLAKTNQDARGTSTANVEKKCCFVGTWIWWMRICSYYGRLDAMELRIPTMR